MKLYSLRPISCLAFSKCVFASLIALALAGLPLTSAAQKGKPGGGGGTTYPYTITQLVTPPGTSGPQVSDLNESGVAVGSANFTSNEWQAFLWNTDGSTVMLPVLANAQIRRATATHISDAGDLICGNSVIFIPPTAGLPYYDSFRATYWERVGGGYEAREWNSLLPADLDIHLYNSMIASDGRFTVLEGADRQSGVNATVIAGIVRENGRITGLEVIEVLSNSRPRDVSFDGVGVLRVLGRGAVGSDAAPFFWRLDLNAIDPQPLLLVADVVTTIKGAVNRFGQVVQNFGVAGSSDVVGLLWQDEAQLWDLGAATDLGTFGGAATRALDINDAGQIVGNSTTGGRREQVRAFLFQDGAMLDLSSLAPVGKKLLTGASRINNAGQILCVNTDGVHLLLTPQ